MVFLDYSISIDVDLHTNLNNYHYAKTKQSLYPGGKPEISYAES